MKKEEVEGVPNGLITCLLNSKEVSIIKISPTSISLRLSEEINKITDLLVNFYSIIDNKYYEVYVDIYSIDSIKKEEFYYVYNIDIEDKVFEQYEKETIASYYKYIYLKNSSEDNDFSKDMVNYPSDKDYDFYDYYIDQRNDWLSLIDNKSFADKKYELAISLDNFELYKEYLLKDFLRFADDYLLGNNVKDKFFNKKVTRIYIGNEYCHNLFPDSDLLFKLLNKLHNEKLNITLCFTYLRECYINDTVDLLDKIYSWCKDKNTRIEIVINDYGFIKMLKYKDDYIDICLGNLLNKRKKDPRYKYKIGYDENKNLIASNSLNNENVNEFYYLNKIARYEYESCGYYINIAKGHHSLHLPFYQTNTSQFCPLYAMCTTGDRGNQKLVKNCPKYCRDYAFIYPKHLKMVGRYNSLFAFDDKILNDKKEFNRYIDNGIDRIVLNFI